LPAEHADTTASARRWPMTRGLRVGSPCRSLQGDLPFPSPHRIVMPPNDASPRPLDDMFGEVYQELRRLAPKQRLPRALVGVHGHLGIERQQAPRGYIDLGLAHVARGELDLPVQVRQAHPVRVRQRQPSHARRRQIQRRRSADAAEPDHGHAGALQRLLPRPADLGQHQMPRIALYFVLRETHGPQLGPAKARVTRPCACPAAARRRWPSSAPGWTGPRFPAWPRDHRTGT